MAHYEIGVIKALEESLAQHPTHDGNLFGTIAGTSSGAINAALLISHFKANHTWIDAHKRLEAFWSEICERLEYYSYWTDPSLNFVRQCLPPYLSGSFEGMNSNIIQSVFEETLKRHIEFPISTNPALGEPRLVAVCTDLMQGNHVSFCSDLQSTTYYDGFANQTTVHYPRGLELKHIMACSAIPFFFKPVTIGSRQFWDGAVAGSIPLEEVMDAVNRWWADVSSSSASQVQPRLLLDIFVVSLVSILKAHYKRPLSIAQLFGRLNSALLGDHSDASEEYIEKASENALIIGQLLEMLRTLKGNVPMQEITLPDGRSVDLTRFEKPLQINKIHRIRRRRVVRDWAEIGNYKVRDMQKLIDEGFRETTEILASTKTI